MDNQIYWTPGVTLEQVERQVILIAFRNFRGNKTVTAHSLGISIRTLDTKLEQIQQEATKDKERLDRVNKDKEAYLRRARGYPPNDLGLPYSPTNLQPQVPQSFVPQSLFAPQQTPNPEPIQNEKHQKNKGDKK